MLVYSPSYEVDIGRHVFPVQKFRLVREKLLADGVAAEADFAEPSAASREELALVHTGAYLDDLLELRLSRRTMSSELPLTRPVVDAYVLAAGGTILAARRALASPRRVCVHMGGGFHHAFADHAEGFCYINDVAVAVRVLQKERAISRAMIIDCDLHQGNGTAHIFSDDPDVFTMSIHQEHNYPVKQRSDIDIGLEDYTRDDEYLAQLERFCRTHLPAHRPDIVFYLAGADPYEHDQLGSLSITMDGLRRRDEMVLSASLELGIPVAVVFAGGYAYECSDTVAIHATTCVVAREFAERYGNPG